MDRQSLHDDAVNLRARMGISRRSFGRWLAALPLLAAPVSACRPIDRPGAGRPSDLAVCLAGLEPGLSTAERRRLATKIAEFEQSLHAVREFTLSSDVAPNLYFRARRSRRRETA